MAKNDDRCWPGYEPVKGKEEHEQGSCRPKADSKMTGTEKEFRGKRTKQLAEWKKQHPGTPPQAAQHLPKPETKSKTAVKKTVKKKAAKKKIGAAPKV